MKPCKRCKGVGRVKAAYQVRDGHFENRLHVGKVWVPNQYPSGQGRPATLSIQYEDCPDCKGSGRRA